MIFCAFDQPDGKLFVQKICGTDSLLFPKTDAEVLYTFKQHSRTLQWIVVVFIKGRLIHWDQLEKLALLILF